MYQNVIIENGARIYQKNNQLYIQGAEEHHLPIEDINMLMLSQPQMTMSAQSLVSLSENGSAVVLCDAKHMPTAMMVPFAANARRLKMIRCQVSQSKPRLKRIWQQIVKGKIQNQGKCLQLAGKKDTVTFFANKVLSGDAKNVEAVAAAVYFKTLFGENFTRHDDTVINGMLNYGYAIFRSAIARYVALYGLEPCWGIFHHSEANAFNLADDMIEPFRPVVDLYVAMHVHESDVAMTLAMRHELVQLLGCNIILQDEIHSVSYAMERVVQSLIRCFTGASESIVVPEVMAEKIHTYE